MNNLTLCVIAVSMIMCCLLEKHVVLGTNIIMKLKMNVNGVILVVSHVTQELQQINVQVVIQE
jgi:hypothetical protein